MKFSIVLPTRNNISGLKKMLQSIEDTAYYLPNIEVLVAVDNDDSQFEEISEIETNVDFKVFRRTHSKNFSQDYYNWLAEKTNGDAIQAFNDDAYFETKNWDLIIEEKVKGRYLWFADTYETTRFMYPSFPMVSRKAYEVLGFLLHPQVRIYPADKKIWEVYNSAGLVVNCLDVRIKHERLENGQQHEGWGEICNEDDVIVRNMDIELDAKKLRDYESSRNNSTAGVQTL